MPPKKELTKHQLSHRLQFQSHTPNFLRAFQAKVSGFRADGDDDEDAPQYANGDEYEHNGREGASNEPAVDEFGREIRRGSEEPEPSNKKAGGTASRRDRNPDEDEEDEMPVVVVLKEGKHLSAREAENERRRARGLSPLPDSDEQDISPAETTTQGSAAPTSAPAAGPSNTKAKSAVQIGGKVGGAKRKVPLGGRDDEQDAGSPANKRIKGASGVGVQKKDKKEKTKKKAVKGLLSFGDDG